MSDSNSLVGSDIKDQEKVSYQPEVTAVHSADGYVDNFASWLYHAKVQRAGEDSVALGGEDKQSEVYESDSPDVIERMQSRRALRTAAWMSCFFLITTDILGPTSAPYALSKLGFASGAFVYTFLGVAAAYSGVLLWQLFLKLDSDRYPVRSYGELAYKVMGSRAKHFINILQSVQLLFNVAIITLGNGQGLSQILVQYNVCFSGLVLIWTALGFLVGSIKSLKNFTQIANFAVILNLLVIFITMGAVAHQAPNYVAAAAQNQAIEGPVVTAAFLYLDFNTQTIAVLNAVYSWGGCMIFLEFMSEMKRPRDFWKGMMYAQMLIYVAYMVFGLFVYAFQGQFVINPANQGISDYAYQTATNVLSLVSALIAAALYGNIGMKVILNTLGELTGRNFMTADLRGRLIWQGATLMYWVLAFIIASAVPQFSAITGLVGALCILQFTYTFPPLFYLAYQLTFDAVTTHPSYDAENPFPVAIPDGWKNLSWWKRALPRQWYWKLANFLMFLASAATAGLGAYSSIEGLIAAFASGAASSFGCASPVA